MQPFFRIEPPALPHEPVQARYRAGSAGVPEAPLVALRAMRGRRRKAMTEKRLQRLLWEERRFASY